MKKKRREFLRSAAGRRTGSEQIDEAFRFALENIKPSDGLIVGMYPRYTDQVGENAQRVKSICAQQAKS